MKLRLLQIVSIASVLLVACGKQNAPVEKKEESKGQLVTVVAVAPQEFNHVLDVKGTVDSRSSAVVSSRTGGLITKLNVANGQAVTKGQVLVEVDAEITRRGMAQLQTQLEFARTMAEKQKRIFDAKAGSEIQYLQAKTQLEAMERQMDQMQEQLDMSRILAPTSGFVDGLTPRLGENIAPGMPLMTIVNTSDMRVLVDISEAYVGTVTSGDDVVIAFSELNDTLRTKANVVSKNVNPISRTFRVEVPLRGAAVRPNMTCNVMINDQTVKNALVVPLACVLTDNGVKYVYTIDDKNIAHRKVVSTGLVSRGSTVVTSGLLPGERVVARGATDIADGQLVSIMQ